MSFEVFLPCLDEDHSNGIPRDAVRTLFPVVEELSEPNRWSVQYDSKNACDIYATSYPADENKLSFLSADRPCSDTRLWESLFAILKMGRVVLYFPGGPPLVADEAVGASLPSNELESMGPHRCVQSAQDCADHSKFLSDLQARVSPSTNPHSNPFVHRLAARCILCRRKIA